MVAQATMQRFGVPHPQGRHRGRHPYSLLLEHGAGGILSLSEHEDETGVCPYHQEHGRGVMGTSDVFASASDRFVERLKKSVGRPR